MTNVLPFFRKQGESMKADSKTARNKDPKKRSIILPTWLWELLDEDADRCLRSTTKQVEAFLTLVYDPEANVEIDRTQVESAFQAVVPKRKVA